MLVQALGSAEEDRVGGSASPMYEPPGAGPCLHISHWYLLSILTPERSLTDFATVYQPCCYSDKYGKHPEEEEVVVEDPDVLANIMVEVDVVFFAKSSR
jgi:hypothetical protein